jgi:uncharacterized repeat protein (TIGR03803 family)
VFGATMAGGATDEGVLFLVDAISGFHLVRSFSSAGGWMPNSVFFSEQGQLYGTTAFGGTYDCGTAYRMDWLGNPQTIHNFDCVHGNQPVGRVVARDGFFYGSTSVGGGGALGSIHRLSPDGTLTVLHEVSPPNYNEAGIHSGLAPGVAEDEFVGATFGYEAPPFFQAYGAVFKIDTAGNYTILHTFSGTDGRRATSPPVVTPDGTLYGTTSQGGAHDAGVLYRITPEGVFSVVYTFGGDNPSWPYGGVMLAKNGNLYGTSLQGGTTGSGTIYELTPSGEFRVVYEFSGVDGFGFPMSGLVETTRGTFYGTTQSGGDHGLGTIYRFRLR